MKRRLPVVQPRSCGSCKECCTRMLIEDFKHENVTCEHLGPKGCMIYNTRPKPCRDWSCLWLVAPNIVPGEMRPDRCGVIVDPSPANVTGVDGPCVAVVEARDGALSLESTRELVFRLARAFTVVTVTLSGKIDGVVTPFRGVTARP